MLTEHGFKEHELVRKVDSFVKFLETRKVGTDIDNTEVAASDNGLRIVNRIYSKDFRLTDLKYDYAIVDLLKLHCPEILNPLETATDIWNSHENVSTSNPTPGALLVTQFLHSRGIQIHRITSRPGNLKDQTIAWYRQKMPWVEAKFIHVQPFSNTVNKRFKVDEAKRIGIDFFIEDVPAHAEAINKATGAIVGLVPQTFNESYLSVSENIITVPRDFYPNGPAYARLFFYMVQKFG